MATRENTPDVDESSEEAYGLTVMGVAAFTIGAVRAICSDNSYLDPAATARVLTPIAVLHRRTCHSPCVPHSPSANATCSR